MAIDGAKAPLDQQGPVASSLTQSSVVRFAPSLTLLIVLGPILAGFIGTVLPAFGYLPALGGNEFTTDHWSRVAAYPGVESAVWRSFSTGLIAIILSFVFVVGFFATCHSTRWFGRARAILAPLLAIPHAAFAMGLAFLLAPSGWLVRAISPWATGFDRPPDWTIGPDPWGGALVLALILKEVPFLLLMTLGALNQVPAEKSIRIAHSLGYDGAIAWLKTVLPQVYSQIRLPIFATLAFSVSVVDVAIILTVAPSPTLGVLILRWANDPDLQFQFMAAVGAVMQIGVVAVAIGLWIAGERLFKSLGLIWIRGGQRHLSLVGRVAASSGMVLVTILGVFGLISLMIWSVTRRWRFPDMLPSQWSLNSWTNRLDRFVEPLLTTLTVGLLAAGIALVLVLCCLEAEQRNQRKSASQALWLVYTPLIVPQIAFLFGAQVLLVWAGLEGGWIGLVWGHLLFVLPYVFLALSDPFRALDPRYARSAACLGARPNRIFFKVKLPMLIHPILIAFAVGFAVSVGEYLPTIFAGAGRLTTLTTEAVALAAGGDRRTIGMLAVLQSVLPLTVFVLASVLPLAFRKFAFRASRG